MARPSQKMRFERRSVGVNTEFPVAGNVGINVGVQWEPLEEPKKPSHFDRLPAEIVMRIISMTSEYGLKAVSRLSSSTDPRDTGYSCVPSSANFYVKCHLRSLARLMRVCRLFFHAAISACYSELFILPSKDGTIERMLSKTLQHKVVNPYRPKCKTYGDYVTKICWVGTAPRITEIWDEMPNLREIRLGEQSKAVTAAVLKTMAACPVDGLRVFREVGGPGPSTVSEPDDRTGAVISVLNAHPALEIFTCRGLTFTKDRSERLLAILTAYSIGLPSAIPQGSTGLTELHFGHQCSLHMDLLEGLARAVPRLEALHIDGGVFLMADPDRYNATVTPKLNVHSWIVEFACLKRFTFIASASAKVTGHFDILSSRPLVETLNIRTDHITSLFWRNICDLGEKHGLQHLTLQHVQHEKNLARFDDYVAINNAKDVLAFARSTVHYTDRGLAYPKSAIGQRDLYHRIRTDVQKQNKIERNKVKDEDKDEISCEDDSDCFCPLCEERREEAEDEE